RYELIVLAISQLSYIPITNTMLSTAFYEPTEVTNLVLLVESLNHPNSRLLGVSLNGWSFSM
ncbi:hypothetical protein TELCIR_21566, partial [Teladorsagia circumcincta]